MTRPTVFVVDDDLSARRGLVRVIHSLGHEAEAFASARDFLDRPAQDDHACLVLDVRMPDTPGPALQDELLRRRRRIPIVVLTGHGDIPTCVSMIKKGAVDFLEKPVEREELRRALEAALAHAGERAAEQATLAAIRRRFEALTPREAEVMQHVTAGALNKQIAAALGIAEKTVKVHRGNMMRKMGVRSVAALVRAVDATLIPSRSPGDPLGPDNST